MSRDGRATAVRILIPVVVLAIAALLSYRFDETRGLAGCGIGVLVAAVMAGTSHALTRRARQASDAKTTLRFVYLSVGATFAIAIGALVVMRALWPEILETAILTAILLHVVVRLQGAVRSWSAVGTGSAVSAPDAPVEKA